MNPDELRYRNDRDYVLTRPLLRPDQTKQVSALLVDRPAQEVSLGALSGTINNQFLSESVLFRVEPSVALTFTGFSGGVSGRFVFIANAGSSTLTLANLNAGSASQNQIITGSGANVTIQSNRAALLIYDGVSQKWRLVAFT